MFAMLFLDSNNSRVSCQSATEHVPLHVNKECCCTLLMDSKGMMGAHETWNFTDPLEPTEQADFRLTDLKLAMRKSGSDRPL